MPVVDVMHRVSRRIVTMPIQARGIVINLDIREILAVSTLDWGIEETLVELKDIQLPDSMKRAMARQAGAEREARQDHQRRGRVARCRQEHDRRLPRALTQHAERAP